MQRHHDDIEASIRRDEKYSENSLKMPMIFTKVFNLLKQSREHRFRCWNTWLSFAFSNSSFFRHSIRFETIKGKQEWKEIDEHAPRNFTLEFNVERVEPLLLWLQLQIQWTMMTTIFLFFIFFFSTPLCVHTKCWICRMHYACWWDIAKKKSVLPVCLCACGSSTTSRSLYIIEWKPWSRCERFGK